jgi:hypothetical protein
MQNGIAIAKPTSVVHADTGGGFAEVSPESTLDQTPGQTVTIKIIGPSIPDDELVNVTTKGVDLTPDGDDNFTLAFTSGESATKTLTAPGQGLKGYVQISGKYIRPQWFYLRGWA